MDKNVLTLWSYSLLYLCKQVEQNKDKQHEYIDSSS